MAVSTTNAISGPYLTNGVTVSFPFTFTAPSADEVAVVLVDEAGAEIPGSGYTVALGQQSGGSVNFYTAPPAGFLLSILLDPSFRQEIAFENGSAWRAEPVNEGYDRSALRDQVLRRDLQRSLRVPFGENGFTLPSQAERFGYAAWEEGRLVSAPLPVPVTGANVVSVVSSLSVLSALIGIVAGVVVYLDSGERSGFFVARSGAAPSDPLQGLFVARFGGYWERIWDNIHAKPEWWGARKNDLSAAVTNRPAIYAALACGSRVTVLEAGDYYCSGTLYVNTPHCILRGSGVSGDDQASLGTRIVCTDLTKDVVEVGAARNVGLEYLTAAWVNDPIIADRGTEAGRDAAPKAFKWKDSPFPRAKGLSCLNPPIGFYFHGTFSMIAEDCRVYRNQVLPGGQDFFHGFWVRGTPRVAAGGNASITLNHCWVGSYYNPAGTDNPIGFLVDYNWADTFLLHCETVGMNTGVHFNGLGADNDGFAQGDVLIDHMTVDQSRRGIIVDNLQPLARLKIMNSYVQVNDQGGGIDNTAILLQGHNGKITIDSTEVLGAGAAATNEQYGIWIHGQPNVVVTDSVLIGGFGYPVTVDGASPRCTIKANIEAGPLTATGKTAVRITNGEQLRIEPAIAGISSAFVRAIEFLGAVHSRCVVDLSQVLPSAISDPGCYINNIKAPAPGYYTQAGAGGSHSDFGVLVQGFTL